jgi:hypothetical protein
MKQYCQRCKKEILWKGLSYAISIPFSDWEERKSKGEPAMAFVCNECFSEAKNRIVRDMPQTTIKIFIG